jgi:hypothetical protein
VGKRPRITEQDDRYIDIKAKVQKDPAGMSALVVINLEDLADTTDAVKETADGLKAAFKEHCSKPIDKAHPPSTAPPADTDLMAGMTGKEKLQLAVMEHRGKIIASVATVILAGLAIVFKTGGI